MAPAKYRRGRPSIKQHLVWYRTVRPTFESMTRIICGILEGLIKDESIDYLSVAGRTKSLDSFTGKLKRKRYKDPQKEVHDFSGIRVIAFIETDVQKITELIKAAFNVHPDKSLDKTDELGTDKAGYRSVHLVCDLGAARDSLPEYTPFKGLLFEIQVRTVLQHAWAEIEHDRNYKFSGVLPPHLERRLNLAAGTLEMVDREFDSLASAIDEYGENVAAETELGNLDIPVNTTSLGEYLHLKTPDKSKIELGMADAKVIGELRDFGITDLKGLDAILTPEFVDAHARLGRPTTDAGYVRSAMMYADLPRYFKDSWKHNWAGMGVGEIRLFASKYGEDRVVAALKKHQIDMLPEDEPDEDSPNNSLHPIAARRGQG